MRKCKTTSFDLTDPYEVELLDHTIKQGKYSKYIKRLIAEDVSKNNQTTTEISAPVTIMEDSTPKEGDVDSFF